MLPSCDVTSVRATLTGSVNSPASTDAKTRAAAVENTLSICSTYYSRSRRSGMERKQSNAAMTTDPECSIGTDDYIWGN